MSILTHTLVTVLGIHLLELRGMEIVLAVFFGMLLDIDHLLKLPLYKKKKELLGKHVRYYNWRTSLQEPVALLWIIPLSLYLNTYIPVVFFLSHLVLDYLVGYNKYPFYPFSEFKTQGFLVNINARSKEIFVIVLMICLNLTVL